MGFSEHFKSVADRENLDRQSLQQRLLLCLYGMGTNTGLKRVSGGRHGICYKELLNVRRRFEHKAALRNAIGQVARAIFAIRNPAVWGEGTTSCASDSKKFWLLGSKSDDGMAYPVRRTRCYDLLACGKEIHMHLLPAQALFLF
ncbi:TPA: Tn3 family transposase [Escherichia coli]|nr:Tn3 family transposase [Escherichia coli]HCO0518602.1 Tn3 family transposase [Escherichia coli]